MGETNVEQEFQVAFQKKKKQISLVQTITAKVIEYLAKIYFSMALFKCYECGFSILLNLKKLKSRCSNCNQVYCSVCKNLKICSRKQGIIMAYVFYFLITQCLLVHFNTSFLSVFTADIVEFSIITGCLIYMISKNISGIKERVMVLNCLKPGRFYLYNFDFKRCLVCLVMISFCICTLIKILVYCSISLVIKILLMCMIVFVFSL